jgi:prepilin-type N-terminal cleavage/methylation domain-containing protein
VNKLKKTYMKKAFTLIELLVVIGVMAVIAAGVIATINPQQKILQARDSQAQSGVGQLATALQSWAAVNTGTYPTAAQGLGQLVTDGELTVQPTAPLGSGGWVYAPAGGPPPNTACVCVNVQAARNIAQGAMWVWCSTRGEAGFRAACN